MLALRSMMATAAQTSLREIRRKTGSAAGSSTGSAGKKGPLPALTAPTRPKSFSEASLPGQNARKASTNSASNLNSKRNVRQRKPCVTNSLSDTTLTRNFNSLSVSDKKKPNSFRATSSNSIRKSSSAGSSSCKTLEDVARLILMKRCKNIVVMAGAGISTPSGIPDFRTPGSGLYDNLQQYRIPYPEAIFDIDFFHRDPRPFFTLAKELYPGGQYKPNYVHYFCRMLHEKGILLRMYTQNIDGLERLAGIPATKLVEAHGTFLKASCTRCGHPHDGEAIKDLIYHDKIPSCSLRGCSGKVKPDIVFFGEDLPKRFFYYLKDLPQCDLVIVMGTSLEVYPFAGIVDSARGYIPRLLINRDLVGPFKKRPGSSNRARFNDVGITGDLVECVQKFARVLGWKKAMEDLIKDHEVLLETESQNILHGTSNEQLANGKAPNGSHDSKSTNEKNGNSISHSDTDGRQSAPVGSGASRNGSSNGTRNYHTLSKRTVPLKSKNKTSPVRNSPSRAASTSLPKIGSRSRDNSWAIKVGRYRTQSSSSSSSSTTDSSSDDSSSDDN